MHSLSASSFFSDLLVVYGAPTPTWRVMAQMRLMHPLSFFTQSITISVVFRSSQPPQLRYTGCRAWKNRKGVEWYFASLCEVKWSLPYPFIGCGRPRERTHDMFLCPELGWPNLEWWDQSIPSGHLATAFSARPVVSFLTLGLAP